MTSADELSIDSKNDTKIQMSTRPDKSQKCDGLHDLKGPTSEMSPDCKSDTTSAAQKPHFRIDWRQLTYFKKEHRSSRMCQFFNSDSGEPTSDRQSEPNYGGDRKTTKQQQLRLDQLDESLYDFEYDSRCEDDGDFSHREDATSGRLSQSLESGRASRSSSRPQSGLGQRKHRQPILNSLDGCFRSGQLSAIMGPSGAGKSTFLSALFGNKQESSFGMTRVTWFKPAAGGGAHESDPAGAHTKRSIRIASLPQHDHLLSHLTVYETLMFASKIKNPRQRHASGGGDSFHRSNVRRVAKTLKLTECLQTRCGRLSGGQYKRVSIGQELLSEPDVIILDEPTSGLDAMTCLTTIRTLKSIVTKHPISIILTIHQPDMDVFNLFDHVYVIAQGGLAIYEGPPGGVAPTLAQVGLVMPEPTYNPARFIVENAFVCVQPDESLAAAAGATEAAAAACERRALEAGSATRDTEMDDLSGDDHSEGLCDGDQEEGAARKLGVAEFLRQSISSITAALAAPGQDPRRGADSPTVLNRSARERLRDSGRQPLLQIGIQTADGKLITRNQLNGGGGVSGGAGAASSVTGASSRAATLIRAAEHWEARRQVQERLRLMRRLNEIQKLRYYASSSSNNSGDTELPAESSFTESDMLSQQTRLSVSVGAERQWRPEPHRDGGQSVDSGHQLGHSNASSSPCSSAPSSTSSSWSVARDQLDEGTDPHPRHQKDQSVVICGLPGSGDKRLSGDAAAGAVEARRSPSTAKCETSASSGGSNQPVAINMTSRGKKLRRQFDKRLSSKRIQAGEHTIWYHSLLLTHRTWLSIVRDPVFFGIQFAMHTTIPILLAVIFGSHQEEGCPRAGNFDLVEFAYAQEAGGGADFLRDTMQSLRQSIGNIGVVFFEMFVLSFAINCITALVFPLDMHVLLKEHRNGWYSLASYFFGRTLADLPVPVVLHSMAMSILCYMTGQPLSCWRFASVLAIVIVASLVAQSVGLTIGALLMRSSQSAVLAAAGIVAPFFALSGFIVRIHTLPLLAQWAAQASYLYHLINGFIIIRYGFDRCPCAPEDFFKNESHEIPQNLRTMASIWIGTYSNEFEHANGQQMDQLRLERHQANRTNLDPNIDIIEKLLGAFRMANSFGHKVENCDDVLPYAMLDFNLRDSDIWHCVCSLIIMLIVTRFITFSAIYYKIRSYS